MKSQNQKIFSYLEKGNSISSLTAFKWFNITRLSARIHDLINEGKTIYHIWQGEGQKKHKVYFTEKSFLYKKHIG